VDEILARFRWLCTSAMQNKPIRPVRFRRKVDISHYRCMCSVKSVLKSLKIYDFIEHLGRRVKSYVRYRYVGSKFWGGAVASVYCPQSASSGCLSLRAAVAAGMLDCRTALRVVRSPLIRNDRREFSSHDHLYSTCMHWRTLSRRTRTTTAVTDVE